MEPKSLNVGPDYTEGTSSKMKTLFRRSAHPGHTAQTTQQTEPLGRRLQRALTGGGSFEPSAPDTPSGRGAALLVAKRHPFFLIAVALMAALAVSMSLLWSGGYLQAQQTGCTPSDDKFCYAEDRTDAVATFTAADPEGAAVSWSLSGMDADDFMIDSGVLSFAKSPDYEKATDGDTNNDGDNTDTDEVASDNVYEVTVQATDETMTVGMKEITVEVTNVNEDGTVTLSARRPQSAAAFTADVTDPDGAVSNPQWQWSKSGSRNGTYVDIENATNTVYTPADKDIGAYLRATVTYTDPEGADSAMESSELSVASVRGNNNPPAFDDDQDPVTPGDQGDAARDVAENTEAGVAIGSPVMATDEDGDDLTYTLWDTGGATQTGDSLLFAIDWDTGQIRTKGTLNHETGGGTYTLVVRATDPAGDPDVATAVAANSDFVTVVITIDDVNEAPTITGDAAVTFQEDTGAITTELATYTGADEDDDDTPHPGTVSSWSVGGADGSKFNIGNETGGTPGQLKFKVKPDFENPTDADGDNVYEVTVQASDGVLTGMHMVKVTVANENEDGTVTLNRVQPRAGIPVTASVSDLDGRISKLTWQWYRGTNVDTTSLPATACADDSSNDCSIDGAKSAMYTPTSGDVGETLTAVASYTDGEASGQVTAGEADNATALDTRNKAPVFNDQDAETDGVQNTMAMRSVEENTEVADPDDDAITDSVDDNVGSPVTATDTKADGTPETLIYTLSGPDAASFRVRQDDATTTTVDEGGQIEVGSGTMLDYEGKRTYMVTVTAEDSFGLTASIDVTIMVTALDEPPAITGDDEAEYAEDRTDAVATFTAADPEGAAVSWSLSGMDADDFMIDSGVLSFAKSPDYEKATDGDTNNDGDNTDTDEVASDNVYEVTVQATDETMTVGMKEITVEVTNVNEDGTVTLSARRPQSAAAFTADVTDPDGAVSNPQWQWSKSGSRNGTYVDIENATNTVYTPADKDIGAYLRATVTYTDPEGADSAMESSELSVASVRGNNNPPAFDDDQDPVTPGDQGDAARDVAENTEAGVAIGSPVMATDEDGDDLTYTLWDTGGATQTGDSLLFAIDWDTGQIRTKGTLNHETGGGTYTLVVRATDPAGDPDVATAVAANSDFVTVVITIDDVNEAPTITGDAAVTFQEDTGAITTELATYTGADEDDDDTPHPGTVSSWSVGGADGSKFNIGNETGGTPGQLKFKVKPDFENPTDADGDNVYEVTVQASDGVLTGMHMVKVTVANENEDGTVTLNRVRPRAGIPVTASVSDLDGRISRLTWQWYRGTNVDTTSLPATACADDSSNDCSIDGAKSAMYTPTSGDVGETLTAVASYTDGEASGQVTAGEAAAATVEDTRNKAPVFNDQDAETDGVQNTMAMRSVEENTEAFADDSTADNVDASNVTGNDNVGSPVTATDPDPNSDPLIYTLSGPDAASFRVRQDDATTTTVDEGGQIEVGSGTMLNYEGKRTYMVTVTAEDSFGATASIDVTIMVTDLDEGPVIVAGGLAIDGMVSLDVMENVTSVGTYRASGPDNAMARWTLEGADAMHFSVGTATGEMTELMFSSAPDYEMPRGMAQSATNINTYMVTLKADDGTYSDTHEVTVMVTNEQEDGTVTITPTATAVNTELTATLSDPDGGVTGVTWQWASENPDGTYSDIAGETDATYTPVSADTGKHLQATATYTDALGSDQPASAITADTVTDRSANYYDSIAGGGNDNGTIDVPEVLKAVQDYFAGNLPVSVVLEVVTRYFAGT